MIPKIPKIPERLERLERARTIDVVRAIRAKGMALELTARARAARNRKWRTSDLYEPESLLPESFRFRIGVATHRLGSSINLTHSQGMLDTMCELLTKSPHLLPAVCADALGLMMFASDVALPAYPRWQIYWPVKNLGDSKHITAIRIAKWKQWIDWAATMPVREIVLIPPAGLTGNERLLWDYIVQALGLAPTAVQCRYRQIRDGVAWLFVPTSMLAAELRLSDRQVQAARKGLIEKGGAESLEQRGSGAAWGIRLVSKRN